MPNCKNQAGEGHLQIVKRLSYEVRKPSTTVKPCMGPGAWQSNECPGPLWLYPAQGKNKGTGFYSCQRVF